MMHSEKLELLKWRREPKPETPKWLDTLRIHECDMTDGYIYYALSFGPANILTPCKNAKQALAVLERLKAWIARQTRHEQRKEPQANPALHECPFCGLRGFTGRGLKQHLAMFGCEAFDSIDLTTQVDFFGA